MTIDRQSVNTWDGPAPVGNSMEGVLTLHGVALVLPGPTPNPVLNTINVRCWGDGEWRSARITAV